MSVGQAAIIEDQASEIAKLKGIVGILCAKIQYPFFGVYTKEEIEHGLEEEVKVTFDRMGGAVLSTGMGS